MPISFCSFIHRYAYAKAFPTQTAFKKSRKYTQFLNIPLETYGRNVRNLMIYPLWNQFRYFTRTPNLLSNKRYDTHYSSSSLHVQDMLQRAKANDTILKDVDYGWFDEPSYDDNGNDIKYSDYNLSLQENPDKTRNEIMANMDKRYFSKYDPESISDEMLFMCENINHLFFITLSRHDSQSRDIFLNNIMQTYYNLPTDKVVCLSIFFYERLIKIGLRLWCIDMETVERLLVDIYSRPTYSKLFKRQVPLENVSSKSSFLEIYNLPKLIGLLYMTCAMRCGNIDAATSIFHNLQQQNLPASINSRALMNMTILNSKFNNQGAAESYFSRLLSLDSVSGICLLNALTAIYIMYDRAREYSLASAKIDQIEEFIRRLSSLPTSDRDEMLFDSIDKDSSSNNTRIQQVQIQKIFEILLERLVNRNNMVKMKSFLEIMQSLNIPISQSIAESEIRAYSNAKALENCKSVMTKIKLEGKKPSFYMYIKLMSLYCRLGDVEAVDSIMNTIRKNGLYPDIRCWNIKLKVYSMQRSSLEIDRVYTEMIKCGLNPNANTLSIMAQSYLENGDFNKVMGVIDSIGRKNKNQDALIGNYVIKLDPKRINALNSFSEEKKGNTVLSSVVFDKLLDIVKSIEENGGKIGQSLLLCIVSSLLHRGQFKNAMEILRIHESKMRISSSIYLELFKYSLKIEDSDSSVELIYRCLRYGDNWDNLTSKTFLSYSLMKGYLPLAVEIANAHIIMGRPISYSNAVFLIDELRKLTIFKTVNSIKFKKILGKYDKYLKKLQANPNSPNNRWMKKEISVLKKRLEELEAEKDSLPNLNSIDPFAVAKSIYNYIRRASTIIKSIAEDGVQEMGLNDEPIFTENLEFTGTKLYAEMIDLELMKNFLSNTKLNMKQDITENDVKENWVSCLKNVQEFVVHVFEDRGVLDLHINLNFLDGLCHEIDPDKLYISKGVCNSNGIDSFPELNHFTESFREDTYSYVHQEIESLNQGLKTFSRNRTGNETFQELEYSNEWMSSRLVNDIVLSELLDFVCNRVFFWKTLETIKSK